MRRGTERTAKLICIMRVDDGVVLSDAKGLRPSRAQDIQTRAAASPRLPANAGPLVRSLGVPRSEAPCPCDLLDLDNLHGGMLVRAGYVFVSETAPTEGLRKYEPARLLNGLIEERQAA